MSAKKVLAAVLAHPDDETFSVGGTLALYAAQGAAVHLLCATRGEAGDAAEQYLRGYTSIAELRTAELQCAAGELGLASVTFLGYRDSGMAGSEHNRHPQALVNAPPDALAQDIAARLRILRPQVVITHDPLGGYPHPDHVALHHAVKRAFHEAAIPQKLYCTTIPRRLLRWLVRLMPLAGRDPRRFGNNGDIDLKMIADADIPVNARIDYSAAAGQRRRASMCYASQGGEKVNRGVAGLLRGWSRRHEVFMRVHPQPFPGEKLETDLFEGVTLEV